MPSKTTIHPPGRDQRDPQNRISRGRRGLLRTDVDTADQMTDTGHTYGRQSTFDDR